MPSRIHRCAPALTLALLLGACAGGPPKPRVAAEPAPKLRVGARDQVGPRLTNYGEAVLPPSGVITVWSDDLTSAEAGAPQAKGKVPSLADELAKATGLKVVDHSAPGQTAAEGLAALAAADAGNLVVICYGYGDAARKTADFRASIDGLIRLAHTRGAPVIVLTEPLPIVPALPAVVPGEKAPKVNPVDAQRRTVSIQVKALQDIVRAAGPVDGAAVVDADPVLSPPAPSPKAQPPRILTDREKEPTSPLARARLAHAIAGHIELAR